MPAAIIAQRFIQTRETRCKTLNPRMIPGEPEPVFRLIR
jgi:hypothetical protein